MRLTTLCPNDVQFRGAVVTERDWNRALISEACQHDGVKRIVVFGSALVGRFVAYFGLKETLEALVGRSVDLVAALRLIQ